MRRLLAALAAGLVLAGCGVPADRTPRTIDPPVVVGSPETPTAQASLPPGSVVEKLYLVRAGRLTAVERRVDGPATLDRQLNDLLAGPTEQERDSGFGSALEGTDLIIGAALDGGTAIVTVGDTTIRNDEVLAYGQIVCTLASRDDVGTVRFLQDGRALEVPRADGSLTSDPLTTADYATLISVR
ncbi:GerMN domain-containing protein [Dactylosporangium sp. AC04546]|uniref:GerMN domain-containing protein n=1 Tax=Dactylosporangium sp. AC04546 TaxID=2862460 RepID=UPI001EDFF3CE|nr:GerMN domain-containing protein [Dactylosporangium sp. AC04546]WVK80005.1 GerMN domain-containing protein [Dactylosporangium sp. AC04546]